MNYKWLLMLACVLMMACDSAPTVTRKGKVSGADQPNRRAAPPPASGPPVGSEAPEIEGVDLDGVEFKLSDYRGKVVMLDFWGNW